MDKSYDEFVKSVEPTSDKSINVRFATTSNDVLDIRGQNNCFSGFSRYMPKPTNYDAIFLQVLDKVAEQWAGTTEKEFFVYYEWLFNYSPLRNAFIHKDVSRVMKDKVVVFDPNQDSRVVINAMFATRMIWEALSHPYVIAEKIRIWNDMIDMGVEPNQAFVLCVNMNKDNEGYKVCTYCNNHEFMDGTEIKHLNFLSSSLNLLGKSFNEVGGYQDVTKLWDNVRTGFSSLEFVQQRWDKVKKENNPFAAPVIGNSILNRDAFLGTLKEITTDYQSKLKELKVI